MLALSIARDAGMLHVLTQVALPVSLFAIGLRLRMPHSTRCEVGCIAIVESGQVTPRYDEAYLYHQ
ncbi:hypothetical protein [Paraburkholderia piptadeniae]|uniref:hypothetical protein n=1 Tax=Paraburkholderia piptadeniae TaxID=1701573 RepID=UPI000B3F7026|nr:hypothetical protein [Paraburkholderia piptadeniae]